MRQALLCLGHDAERVLASQRALIMISTQQQRDDDDDDWVVVKERGVDENGGSCLSSPRRED